MNRPSAWDAKYQCDQLDRASLHSAAVVASVRATLARITPWADVLEAGSGTGRLSVYLAYTAHIHVTALDLSTEALALGRRLAENTSPLLGTLSFIEASLYEMPFQDGSFDIVLSDSVIEHLADPKAALTEFRRVLRPGGAIIVSVPNRWRPDGWDLYRRLARPPYRQVSFSPLELRSLVEDAGFTPVEMFGDELWLPRNIGLLRSVATSSSTQHGRRFLAHTTVRSATRRRLRGFFARILPSWLYVNVGMVAERR